MYRFSFIAFASLLLALPAFAQYSVDYTHQGSPYSVFGGITTYEQAPGEPSEPACCVPVTVQFQTSPVASSCREVDLETITLKIMNSAFQVGEYDTVERLFYKLSLSNKMMFLEKATEMSNVLSLEALTELVNGSIKRAPMLVEINALTEMMNGGNYDMFIDIKTKQVELLGRLAESLFEENEAIAVVHHEEDFCTMGEALVLHKVKDGKGKNVSQSVSPMFQRIAEMMTVLR